MRSRLLICLMVLGLAMSPALARHQKEAGPDETPTNIPKTTFEDPSLIDSTNDSARDAVPVLVRHAWKKACAAAGVDWVMPPNLSIFRVNDRVINYEFRWGQNGQPELTEVRTYGKYFEVSGINPETGLDVTNRYIALFLPKSEKKSLVLDVLTHELLHYVFLQKCKGGGDFYEQHRDQLHNGGEEWVRSIFHSEEIEGDE